MAVSNDLSSLDFAAIKQRLIDSYKNNPKFADYDFEGSTLSILFDILAYVTHYQGVHAHFAFAERFLDSATLRSSISSIVKEIGYLPRQATAANARITVSFPKSTVDTRTTTGTANDTSFTITNPLLFSGTNTDGTSFSFTTLSDSAFTLNTTTNNYEGTIDIFEGTKITERFTYDNAIPNTEFVLANSNIDLNTIVVKVKSSSSALDNSAETYTRATDITVVNSTSKVFFVQEEEGNKLEIYFGDGVIGYEPPNGSEVIVEYLTTNTSLPNGINSFALTNQFQILANGTDTINITPNDVTITTISPAQGGSEPETNESIKHYAPLFYQSQNRAVTVSDYLALINNHFSWVQSSNVWGGEDNNPPQYGKVFVSIKPTYGLYVNNIHKSELLNFLNSKKVIGTVIEIVDADIMFVDLNVNFKIDSTKSTNSTTTIANEVATAIHTFFNSISNKFNNSLKYSRLLNAIDNADLAIDSNIVDLTLRKSVSIIFSANTNYSIDFGNPLSPNSIISEKWNNALGQEAYVEDDGNGIIRLIENGTITNENVGTVDYSNGKLSFSVLISSHTSNLLYVSAKPANNDIVTTFNSIIQLGSVTTNPTVI